METVPRSFFRFKKIFFLFVSFRSRQRSEGKKFAYLHYCAKQKRNRAKFGENLERQRDFSWLRHSLRIIAKFSQKFKFLQPWHKIVLHGITWRSWYSDSATRKLYVKIVRASRKIRYIAKNTPKFRAFESVVGLAMFENIYLDQLPLI